MKTTCQICESFRNSCISVIIRKIELAAMMVYFTAIVFGQVSDFNIPEKRSNSGTGFQFNNMKQDPNAIRSDLIQKIHPKNLPNTKSFQTVRLKLDSIIVKTITYGKNPGLWEGLSKDAYTYNSEGNLIRFINYNWDNNIKKWKITKNDYSYTLDGKLAQSIYNVLDNASKKWMSVSKDEYTYDIKGNLTLVVCSAWNKEKNRWEAIINMRKSYGSNGNLTDEIWYSGVDLAKMEYTYDERNNLIQYIRYSRDMTNNHWIAEYKKVFTYDSINNLIHYVYYDTNKIDTRWQESSKEEYTYGTNGNLIQDIRFNWDISNKQWVVEWKYEYVYDDSFSFSDLIIPDLEYFYYSFNHKLNSFTIFTWERSTNQWIPDQTGTLYYSENDIKEKSESGGIKVYPNPVSKILYISLPDYFNQSVIELFDSGGRKVLTKDITSVKNVNVEILTSAIYLYNLIIDGEMYTGKIIKQ